MMKALRGFQYAAPCAPGSDNTRWIAAPDAETADKAAKRRGWKPCGGEILIGSMQRYSTAASLRDAGFDVIVRA